MTHKVKDIIKQIGHTGFSRLAGISRNTLYKYLEGKTVTKRTKYKINRLVEILSQ